MEEYIKQISTVLGNYNLTLNSWEFHVAAGLPIFFAICALILWILSIRRKKKIRTLESTLTKELDKSQKLSEEKDEISEQYAALSKDNENTLSLLNTAKQEKKSFENQVEKLNTDLKLVQENAESDLAISRTIIQKREEEYHKLNQTFLAAQEQLRIETQENMTLSEEVQNQKETIENLEYNLKQSLETSQNQQTKIEVLEDEIKLYQKRKAEEVKRQKLLDNMAQIRNAVYHCFQNLEHPVFQCYRDKELRGTYSHVNQVARLSYYGAISIQGNSEYARASALFHDLGKTFDYKYFKENWPHNKSLKLDEENFKFTFTHRGQKICAHVEKGLLAFQKVMKEIPEDVNAVFDKNNLSETEKAFIFEETKEELQKSILEHQAKSQIRMLYEEAKKNGEICKQQDFEYSIGQIPSNKEQGIICLADSCEAAFSSQIHTSEEAIARLIKQVVTGRLNAGHLNDSGLSLVEVLKIQSSFIDYLTEHWRSSRPDRMEDKIEADPEGYSVLDSGSELIRQMAERYVQGDTKQKRKILCSFLDFKQKTLNTVNIEDLIRLVEQTLETETDDNILITNGLVVLTEYYRSIASLIIEDIQKHHPIHFKLNKDTVDLELMQNSDIYAYIHGKPQLKQYLTRMQDIREKTTSTMRRLRIYESPDIYVIRWATQIDNYLNNQSNIPETIEKSEKIDVMSQLQNVVTIPEDFSFIDVKQGMVYTNINLDIYRCDCQYIQLIVYFYDHKRQPLKDVGGMFCTRTSSQVAILQSFLIKNSKFFTVKESAMILPQTELHLEAKYNRAVIAKIQVHGLRADAPPILLFDREEKFHLEAPVTIAQDQQA